MHPLESNIHLPTSAVSYFLGMHLIFIISTRTQNRSTCLDSNAKDFKTSSENRGKNHSSFTCSLTSPEPEQNGSLMSAINRATVVTRLMIFLLVIYKGNLWRSIAQGNVMSRPRAKGKPNIAASRPFYCLDV